ncbi:MAG TPA: helix-turn-helix domain-containing protein [Thermoanaerobaculia bacterium]|nr:helix-turn-helix domain-containing protein [Thermoanaerobaculia bacterium]
MAVSHLPGCRLCWDRAARVVAELKSESRLAPSTAAAREIVDLLEREQARALRWLLARSRWAELKRLPARRQLDRIATDPELRTLEMFAALAEEAAGVSQEDPHLGEETASVAYALAGALPGDRHPEPFRNDLQAEAMMIVANCRQLTGDWQGSAAALATSRGHLQRGTGEPAREARLLSIEASLASDTGRLEQALELLGRSSALYHGAQDDDAIGAVTVQEANTLIAACRHEEAIARAEEALSGLPPEDARLEMLARNVITESFVFLGRPDEALQSYLATQPLHKQLRGRRTELQVGYLEALLLDAQDHAREAEKAFRKNIADRMGAEHYKDAFLTLVTFLQSLVRRGAFDKAARACEEALDMIERAGSGCHSQMAALWRSLLNLIDARRLTERHVLAARLYLVRHWNAPARHAVLELPANVPRAESSPPDPLSHLPVPPTPGEGAPPPKALKGQLETTGLAQGGYEEALERFDRALIAAGLERCGGRRRETARQLGISRNTLRDKIRKYGLEAGELASAAGGPGLPCRDEEIQALSRVLRARALWGELKSLPHGQRLDRIQTVSSLQTREVFDAILDEASTVALNNPLRGEEMALLAHTLAGLLPQRGRSPEAERNDLQGTALQAAANCRRLAGDWQGSAAAFDAARSHLAQGSGEPAREARFLSVQASLLADTRQMEPALALLARAAALYRNAKDPVAVAAVTVQEANTLMSACRHEEAIARAKVALRRLPPGEARLELLARNIVIESLVFLGRPDEALHNLVATLPLYEELRSLRTELQLGYLEALLLDALGYASEAEAAFRNNIARRMDAELYKDAFLTVMTRLEFLLQRGELEKAARACDEALARIEDAGMEGHAPIQKLWRALLVLVRERALTESHLLEARHYLVRWGAVSVHRVSPRAGVLLLPAWVTGTAVPEAAASAPEPLATAPQLSGRLVLFEPPDPAASLAELGYKPALERYSRQLLAAGLDQGKGQIAAASRLLGMTPDSLRAKLKGFLTGEEE